MVAAGASQAGSWRDKGGLTSTHPGSNGARRTARRLGVEVRLGAAVTRCVRSGAVGGENPIESRTLIWAAASPHHPQPAGLASSQGAADKGSTVRCPAVAMQQGPNVAHCRATGRQSGRRPCSAVATSATSRQSVVGRRWSIAAGSWSKPYGWYPGPSRLAPSPPPQSGRKRGLHDAHGEGQDAGRGALRR